MSDQEKRIHAFFDDLKIFQMEIKSAIEDQNRGGFESPKLASEFRRRSYIAQASQSMSPSHSQLRHRFSSFKIDRNEEEVGTCKSEQLNS